MKEASYYDKLNGAVRCFLCPKNCVIQQDCLGFCNTRQNRNGRLYSLVFGKPCALNVDPIEKKPLYHFLPGNAALSIGTVGCNFRCRNCQNWDIAMAKPGDVSTHDLAPEQVVDLAKEKNCSIIAYTYNEPAVYYEYMLKTAKIAGKEGIRNIIVSNGFINPAPLKELCRYIDSANIDLKSFDDDFYRNICSGKIGPVLDSLKILKKEGVWLEVTNLLIPGKNDDLEVIGKMCRWIKENLGKDTPLHFSGFHQQYKMKDVEPTKVITLENARSAASKYLDYVYIGNVQSEKGNNTYCPECNNLLISRYGFEIAENNLENGKCSCGHEVSGVWQ